MDRIAALEKLVEQQAVVIAPQSARIAELEKRLNKNSNNSSKPPSSDGLSKPPRTNSLRQKGKNRSGGQLGHKGDTLKQVQTPDKIERHKLSQCSDCSTSLISVEALGIIKRQVFDKCTWEVTKKVEKLQVLLNFCVIFRFALLIYCL